MCCSGANNIALAWGPTIGSKVVKYQVAAPTAALCAFIGALLFGERSAPLYGGYLYDWSVLKIFPELTMYSMIWPPIVVLLWQALALWWQVPVIHYLGYGETLNKHSHCLLSCTLWHSALTSIQIKVDTEYQLLVSGQRFVEQHAL